MKRYIFSLLIGIFLLSSNLLSAKEGMWLPILLEKINADEMHRMGMKITVEEIYSMKHSSLKDAIVHFGGGCTAELVSSQGLLFTNHHCGYSSIQKHSTVEHDYLTNGFWADSLSDELPNPGLTAKIMTDMIDVSEEVLAGVSDDMSEYERNTIIQNNISALIKKYEPTKFKQVDVKAFFYGHQYILMTYTVFRDVRLVGAPPSNIGKFGGDTDNWMWPRHTGDFSVFRIYADAENKAADYSIYNKPYQAVQHLKISLKGVNEGDFTMVYGYPGRTQEYLPSYALKLITEKVNPFRIQLRRERLDIMSAAMNANAKTRIQYSAKYASVANGWKKWIGENKGIKRMNAIQTKQQEEIEFNKWLDSTHNGDQIIANFEKEYKTLTDYEMAYYYFIEAGYYQELVRYAWRFKKLGELSNTKPIDSLKLKAEVENIKSGLGSFFKDYDRKIDQELFLATAKAYNNFPYNAPKPAVFEEIIAKKYNNNIEAYTADVYKNTILNDNIKLLKFLDNYSPKDWEKIAGDPLFIYASSILKNYQDSIFAEYNYRSKRIDSLQQRYMQLILEKNKGHHLYPDANSTLRIAYGKVEGYEPRDGVEYKYFTTLSGIMAKENPNIYDYVVEPKLKELYRKKDYGQYGDKDGKMHVCFIASNHTTGGNSGSPVLNAQGHLIGLNFDRNWEGTMSDLKYDPDQCRNITLDIRYCLFIIDKYAGADRLIKEMDLVI